jgi:hypothetical protein
MNITFDDKIIGEMCQYVSKTKMIPKSKFVHLSSGLTAILDKKESPIFQKEYGMSICRGNDSKIYLTEPCEGIRKCSTSKCEKGSKIIGTFHNHPSTAPLPSYTDFEGVFMDQEIKHPRIDCIGGYITPKERKIVCLASKTEFHGLKEDVPYWKKDYAEVRFYDGDEQLSEPYMLSDQRMESLKNGLEVLKADPRFDIQIFDCGENKNKESILLYP